jgi:hypothetical protein
LEPGTQLFDVATNGDEASLAPPYPLTLREPGIEMASSVGTSCVP